MDDALATERLKVIAFLTREADRLAKEADEQDDKYAADAAVTVRRLAQRIVEGRHDQA